MKIPLLLALFAFASISAPPASLSMPKKPNIAVLTLKATAGVEPGESEVISDRLRNELFQTGLVEVMERDQMQAVLKEQGFQQSGVCTDEGCMVEIGQLLGVQRIVTGSIGKLGRMFMVNLRSVDVQTGKLARAVSRDIKGNIEDLVGELPGIAAELVDAQLVVKPVKKEPPPPVVDRSEPPPAPEPARKGGKVYLAGLVLPPDIIKFSLTGAELDEVNAKLLEAIDNVIDPEVILAPADEMATAAGNDAIVIRLTIVSYVTKPARAGQVEGTVDVLIDFFKGPTATRSLCSVHIKETGERHWGEATPFANAMEAVAEAAEEDLGDIDFVEKFNRGK